MLATTEWVLYVNCADVLHGRYTSRGCLGVSSLCTESGLTGSQSVALRMCTCAVELHVALKKIVGQGWQKLVNRSCNLCSAASRSSFVIFSHFLTSQSCVQSCHPVVSCFPSRGCRASNWLTTQACGCGLAHNALFAAADARK